MTKKYWLDRHSIGQFGNCFWMRQNHCFLSRNTLYAVADCKCIMNEAISVVVLNFGICVITKQFDREWYTAHFHIYIRRLHFDRFWNDFVIEVLINSIPLVKHLHISILGHIDTKFNWNITIITSLQLEKCYECIGCFS